MRRNHYNPSSRYTKEPLACEFGTHILLETAFQRSWVKLPAYIQHLAKEKVCRLENNPRCPSLQVHRYQSLKDVWICKLNRTYRLLFRYLQGGLALYNIGPHGILDSKYGQK